MPLLRRIYARRLAATLEVCVVVCLSIAVAMPGTAAADGDPASDVLVGQSVYLPPDAGATVRMHERLAAVLAASARAGFPVRVAIIASPTDLGSIGVLWRRPRSYAPFLGQELALAAATRVLVVMPNGLGLYVPGGAPAPEQAVIAAGAGRGSLTAIAIATVQRLAAAAGHPLPAAATTPPSSPESGGSGSPAAWGVFAAGLALLLAAWTLSLRARPLRRRVTPPGSATASASDPRQP
jgi:hypothetical protein